MLVAVDGIFKCQIHNKHFCFLMINGFLLNMVNASKACGFLLCSI